MNEIEYALKSATKERSDGNDGPTTSPKSNGRNQR